MEEQLVVAVYDTATSANAALQDLRDAGIPENAINRHARTDHHDSAASHDAHEEKEKPGFWQRLFGRHDHDEDTSVYDRNIERGATVIAVRAPITDLDRIEEILERHDPVDIDEKSVTHRDGEGLVSSMGAGTAPKVAPDGLSGHDSAHADPAMPGDHTGPDERGAPLSDDERLHGQRDGERSPSPRVRRHMVNPAIRDEEVLDRTTNIDTTHRDTPLDPDRR